MPPWNLSAADFFEWLEYWRIEPFGDEWRQAATVAWAGHVRFKDKVAVEDFMPIPKPKQTKEQMLAAFGAMFGVAKQLAEQNHGRKSG